MSSAARVDQSRPVTLWLPFEYQWALHHLLLDRLQQGTGAGTQTNDIEGPLQIEVYEAFETLDSGDLRFTEDQVEAMRRVLRWYQQYATRRHRRRDRIDELVDRLSGHLDRHRQTTEADRQEALDLPAGVDGSSE